LAELVSYVIPSLVQGISQQPDSQRDPGQGEIQINGVSSITEGLRKRDNSRVLAQVSGSPFGDAFIHSILRDQNERYLAVISKTSVRVFELDGTERRVTVSPQAVAYLSNITDARRQIRAVSIADYTYVLNTIKPTAMSPAVAPPATRPAAHECLIWVKAANYGGSYIVNVNGKQVEVKTAIQPVVTNGLTITENRISTADVAEALRLSLTTGPVTTFTQALPDTKLNGTKKDLPTTSSGLGSGIKVDVVGDGTKVTSVTMVKAGTAYAVGDKVFVAKALLEGGNDNTPIEVGQVAALGPAPLTGVTITRSGSVLWLQSANPITVQANDARGNADITAILNQVQAFTELPTIAPKGYQIEITGDPGNNFDGYYVTFNPRSGGFGEGAWKETVSPGAEYKIDQSTMPHVLVRLNPITRDFWFGPADGSTHSGVTVPSWGQRVAGDYITAPDPSFIGNTINDVFIYKNRLGFLSDENIILSRTREFFEFFPETVTTILDTDPIDLTASNNRVSVLRYAVPYQDELIVFSDQYQFRFNAAESVLTPKSAQITVLTQFEMDAGLRPQQAGAGILFSQSNGQYSLVREFSVRGAGTSLVADAQDLTGHVSSFLPANLYKASVNDTGNSAYFISGAAGHEKRIYVYKYYFRNTGDGVQRIQSSWSYWSLNGADKILQIVCLLENLYLLAQYGNRVYLEVIPVMDRAKEPVDGRPALLLDRAISTTTETPASVRVAPGVYSAERNETTWRLPFTVAAKTQAWALVTRSSPDWNDGVLLGEITSGNIITARGDRSAMDIYFGEAYEFRYRFSRFKMMKEIGGGKSAVNTMRTQVRQAKLGYHESGYFEVHVTPEHRTPAVYRFDGCTIDVRGTMIGHLPIETDRQRYFEGVFNIPIMSRGERCIVDLINPTPHPCKFNTCEWVAVITGKARALQ